MKDSPFLKAGTQLIPIASIEEIDITGIEHGYVDIHYQDNKIVRAESFDAMEAVMLLKPGALEGKRLRWQRNAWAFHNFVAHPLMQIMVWLGFKKAAIRLHDNTVPYPVAFKK